jgi:hypothetical protein
MNLKDEINPEDALKRFRWVDNDHIMIASKWGYEKLLKIVKKDNSKKLTLLEIGFGSIPGYLDSDSQTHFYYE